MRNITRYRYFCSHLVKRSEPVWEGVDHVGTIVTPAASTPTTSDTGIKEERETEGNHDYRGYHHRHQAFRRMGLFYFDNTLLGLSKDKGEDHVHGTSDDVVEVTIV